MKIFLILAAFCASCGSASATTIITYHGSPFTFFIDAPGVPGGFTPLNQISGYFTVEEITPDQTHYLTTLSDYSFTDGLNSFTPANSQLTAFYVGFSYGRVLTDWSFHVAQTQGPLTAHLGFEDLGPATSSLCSASECDEGYASGGGTFSLANPVPEPSTWLMLVCGVAMIGAALRQRRAQAILRRVATGPEN